jgi:hypothetical protein
MTWVCVRVTWPPGEPWRHPETLLAEGVPWAEEIGSYPTRGEALVATTLAARTGYIDIFWRAVAACEASARPHDQPVAGPPATATPATKRRQKRK